MTRQSTSLPLVTVGITCFNAQDSILQALQSAFDQDYPYVEIIVVDDCSSDNSLEVLAGVRSRPFQLICNSSNQGASYCRNLIVSSASGDLLCFIDDDDVALPSRISLQVSQLVDFGFPRNIKTISIPSMLRTYPSGYIRHLPSLGASGPPPNATEMINYLFFKKITPGVDYGFCAPSSAFMVSTLFARSCGGFDPSLRRVEDVDFILRLCFQGASFVGLPQPLVHQTASVGSDKTAFANYLSELSLVDKYQSYLVSIGMYRYSRLSVVLRFAYFSRRFFMFFKTFLLLILEKPFYAIFTVLGSSFNRFVHEIRIYTGI